MRFRFRFRVFTTAIVAGTALFGISGCAEWRGLNSLPLPGTEGKGPGAFEVQIEMPDVNNLQQNSRVRVADVTVGNVTRIRRQGWHALVTVHLNADVDLPQNATARLGQTSLLGSQHVELAAPKNERPQGRLHDGSVIPLEHSGAYPTTEQTLAALSSVLNGGGIGQIQDITEAFGTALNGRTADFRSLIGQLDTLSTNLDLQSDDIIAASDSLNRLVGQLADRRPVLDRALATIPDSLEVLSARRDSIVDAANKAGNFTALLAETINDSGADIARILRAAGPVLESAANAGPSMTRALSGLATFPFPNETIEKWQRGDFANLTAIIDLTLSRIDAAWFTGTRWECNLTELELQWGRTIGQFPSPCTAGGPRNAGNPLVAPYLMDQGP